MLGCVNPLAPLKNEAVTPLVELLDMFNDPIIDIAPDPDKNDDVTAVVEKLDEIARLDEAAMLAVKKSVEAEGGVDPEMIITWSGA